MLPPAKPSSTTVADPTIPESTTSKLAMLITLRNDKRSSTAHPISNFVSYDKLHPAFRSFALSLSSESIPRNYLEAIKIPHWKVAMDEKMEALKSRATWELVTCPVGASIVTCRWVYTMKYKPNGSVDRYKARLVACGNSIWVLLSVAIN